ncbi:MAG: GTP-binding protein [Mariprofundaceae bacterium]|nr:GTP-binding protein [Mariprofundaceae bacterium]
MAHQEIQLLRLATVGSVDDGKSTLIGRLLFDTKGAFEDQLHAVRKQKGKEGISSGKDIDLAMLTDGLQAEREQGITIDVAYRYFSTPKRKFIMADCPGHEQYTRNAITGASTANVAVILLDARKGILPQTRRHTHIVSLLGIPHLVVAINKMDLVDYDQQTFESIRDDLRAYCAEQGIQDLICIPVSALEGDMVVKRGDKMPWYEGNTVLNTLEKIEVSNHITEQDMRFPVQLVVRPQSEEYHDYRGFAGRIASGSMHVGDDVVALPSGKSSKIKEITTFDGNLQSAFAPQSVTVVLEDEIDLSRGDMLVPKAALPTSTKQLTAMICWMGEEPLQKRKKYLLKNNSNTVKVMVDEIVSRTNIQTLEGESGVDTLAVNDIGQVSFKLMQEMHVDDYKVIRATGSVIVIDSFSNATVGAGMIQLN